MNKVLCQFPLEDVTVLPVSSLLSDEWPMMCGEHTVWSSRKPAKLMEEASYGFASTIPTVPIWEVMYKRIYPIHADVIPVVANCNALDVYVYMPLVDLIDAGGVHYHCFGDYALASLIQLCRTHGQPEWDDPVEIQPFYAVGNTLRQHVAFRAVTRDVRPTWEISRAKPQQPDRHQPLRIHSAPGAGGGDSR